MPTWKDKLSKSEAAFVADLVDQVPEAMGARQTFENCLTKLTNSGSMPTFRYVIAGDADVQGTNSLDVARAAAKSDENYVIDTATSTWLCSNEEALDSILTEFKS